MTSRLVLFSWLWRKPLLPQTIHTECSLQNDSLAIEITEAREKINVYLPIPSSLLIENVLPMRCILEASSGLPEPFKSTKLTSMGHLQPDQIYYLSKWLLSYPVSTLIILATSHLPVWSALSIHLTVVTLAHRVWQI